MSDPVAAREALIVEAIGDVAQLMQDVHALTPALDARCQDIAKATNELEQSLAAFEDRISAIAENAKTQTIRYLVARTEEAARKAIDQQSRAMADAARVAFGMELGAALQRLNVAMQPVIESSQRRWQSWLTHAAAAAAASALTWVTILLSGRI